jgi:O-antigen/teichoic acid export membrane protein
MQIKLPSIAKNVLTVSTGVVFGQALSLLAMPVISRFYSAESFGIFGTFLSIASIIGSLVTMQYGVALMLPKRDTEAANVFMLGLFIVVCITGLISIFLAVFPSWSLELMKAPGRPVILLLLPLYVLFNGTNNMCQAGV